MLSDFLPFIAMVFVQLGYAGMNITSKLAMDTGMKPLVLVVYRQVFATMAVVPFAYFLERKTRPKITKTILFQMFLCSLTGATANQVFYYVGLKLSTPTIGCALSNILPAITFILAVAARQESLKLRTVAGQMKVFGTIFCVIGAMLLSFYHGPLINTAESNIHWGYAEKASSEAASSAGGRSNVLGAIFVMLSTVAWSCWFILQARMGEKFEAPYTSTALMCFMASIECLVIGLIAEHDHSFAAWSLKSPIRIVASLYAGIVSNAIAFCLMTYSIQKKGALYVSVFSPLLLIMVAILSWALLREKLFVGTAVGSLMIITGLYAVLWGKSKEEKADKVLDEKESDFIGSAGEEYFQKADVELQMPNNKIADSTPNKATA
ncbi:hypothetical protein ACFE04_028897 [Oxalis oulophora]